MKERNAVLLLLLASFIWGFAFVAQSIASDIIGPFLFNGVRMFLGFIVLLPIVIKIVKRNKNKQYISKMLKGGIVCGFFLASACSLQQIGIQYTTAGKAGFITSLYTLFVPIFSLFIGKKISARIWCCVGVGLLGAFLLSFAGVTTGFGIGKGDLLIFACSVLFAIQILCVDKFGKELEGPDLSAFQFLFGGIFCIVISLITEPVSFKIVKDAALPLLYGGVLSCGAAYTLQIVGQKYVQSTKATLALSLESVWSAVGGAIILNEKLSLQETVGCILLFAAVVISQLPEKSNKVQI